MALHMEFPRRTEIGLGRFTVREVKLGRQTSTLHITLNQNGHDEVLCYLTQSNLNNSIGPSLTTGWKLHPAPVPVDLAKLRTGTDPNWAEQTAMPFAKFRKASTKLRFHFPVQGQVAANITDQWIRFRSGEKFTNESLGFICDSFPQIVDKMSSGSDPYKILNAEEKQQERAPQPSFWYPTVVLNLDIKKALPREGAEWLFTRAMSKQIRDGRLDIEVIIMDEAGDIVALSHHVALVLDASRNLAQRNRAASSPSSKI